MSLHDDALKRLNIRASRLVRLLSLEAPTAIIVIEAGMVADAARLLDPQAWASRDTTKWLALNKPLLGYCSEQDCDQRVADSYDVCPAHIDDEDVDEEADELERIITADPEQYPDNKSEEPKDS